MAILLSAAVSFALISPAIFLTTEAKAAPPLWQTSSSSNQNFGIATSQIHKLEDLLNNAQQTLNNSDYYDFQSRLYNLKQAASLELSRGADGSAILQPLQSLESEILSKTRETGQVNGTKKGQLDLSIMRLEALLKSKSTDLSQEDWGSFFNRIADLKARCLQNAFASDDVVEKMMAEARDIESKIMDKAMFAPHRGSLTFTRDEPAEEKPATSSFPEKRIDSDVATAKKADGVESKPSGNVARAPKKPPVPIPKMIERIENELMDFHEKHQIGSFDMDSFTERLLAQKRNLHVMMSKTGRISARQEAVVRQDLEQLQEDLTNRVTGKN